jgi:beta-galactosidase
MAILKKSKKYRHSKFISDKRGRFSFFTEKIKRYCTSEASFNCVGNLFPHHIISLFFLFVFWCDMSYAQVRKTISLNSLWQTYLLNQEDTNNQWNSKSKNKQTVSIPHNWDDYYGYRRLFHGNLHGSAMYKKTFSVHKEKEKRYFLFFEGVGSYATVWVNNRKAGCHVGGRTTFTLDVTPLLHPGKNDLLVRADHPAHIRDLPWVCGGCSDERGFSEGSQPLGIFRPVSLLVTNEVRVQPFGIHAWADINYELTSLFINTSLKNYSSDKKNVQITQQVLDQKGIVRATAVSGRLFMANDSETVSKSRLTFKNPTLWSVENPYLYKIKTTIRSGNQIIDQEVTDFGFRTVQWNTQTNQFFLNGKPVFINGVAEYEHLIGQSHAFSPEQIVSRVKWLQAAGFNSFRDGHQPHNLLYGRLFNQKGILWWTQLSAHVWFDTPEFKNNFKQLLKEWVIERRNDPSVIMWGLQNESTLPKEFAKECTELIGSLDPTASTQRPVTTCNGGEGSDWNVPQNWTGTYGGNPDAYGEDLKKQVLVGEYGAWRTLDLHTEGGFVQNAPVSEDRFTLLMEKKIRLAESVKDSVAGHYFWLLTTHDNPGRVQGGEGFREMDRIGPVNYKGMLTPWEEPTDVYYMYRSNYVSKESEPMVYIASHTWPNRWMMPGIKDSVIVYSNCDEVELFNDIDNVSLGKRRRGSIGTHSMWDKVNIQYNVLYAVGYVDGKVVAKDTLVFNHLPESPNFNKLYSDAQNILKPQSGYHYVYRINCGGPDYTDQNGNIWNADRPLVDENINLAGYQSWSAVFPEIPSIFASQRRTFSPIKGANDWPLFQTFRYGKHLLKYRLPLPNGDYRVELYFTEPWLGIGGGMDARGMRLFDVSINNKTALKNVDIWKEAGSNKALKKVVNVRVTNGLMTIEFPQTLAGQAIISAIAVASLQSGIQAAGYTANIYELQCDNCKKQSWSDIGDKQYLNDSVQINSLPSNLFGADWIQFHKRNAYNVSFKVKSESDIFIGIRENENTDLIKDFENTITKIITDESGGSLYNVYRKRVSAGSDLNYKSDRPFLVYILPASDMQPAYDLKAVTSYKSDVVIVSSNVDKKIVLNNERTVVASDDEATINWPVTTGVADIYSITIKYNSTSEKDILGNVQLLDVTGNVMVEQNIRFKVTKEAKWNTITFNTGSMINAGHYNVILKVKNGKGLLVSNIDIQ